MAKAKRIFQVAGRGSVAMDYGSVKGDFGQEPNCAGPMWPLVSGIEDREQISGWANSHDDARVGGASRGDGVLGLDESSREKAARKERRRKAFFFPGAYGPGYLMPRLPRWFVAIRGDRSW